MALSAPGTWNTPSYVPIGIGNASTGEQAGIYEAQLQAAIQNYLKQLEGWQQQELQGTQKANSLEEIGKQNQGAIDLAKAQAQYSGWYQDASGRWINGAAEAERTGAESLAALQAKLSGWHQGPNGEWVNSQSAAQLAGEQANALALAGKTASEQRTTEEARYARAKEQQKASNDALDALMGKLGLTGQPESPISTQTGADAAAEEAARAAEFGRAKDQAGQIARASLNDVSELMAARGLRNSGIEAAAKTGVVSGAQQNLGEVSRAQAQNALARRYAVSDRDKAAALTTRGQNTGLASSLAGLYRATSGGGLY